MDTIIVSAFTANIQQSSTPRPGGLRRRNTSNPMGVPVWSHAGIVCTGETYTDKVKLTFARGATLADPAGLFNASLDGGTRRAIDIHEGETIDAAAFKALVRAAVKANGVADGR